MVGTAERLNPWIAVRTLANEESFLRRMPRRGLSVGAVACATGVPIDLEVPDIATRLRCDEPEGLPRKEVIQPQLPLRLPCYDFTPITSQTLDGSVPCGFSHRLLVQPAFVV